MEKLPRALVELLVPGVGIAIGGIEAGDDRSGRPGLVTSSMVIQVALPKPLISLEPLIVIGPVTIGSGLAPVPRARRR